MVNWSADFLAAHPEQAALGYVRNRHGFTFFNLDGTKTTVIVGRPAHYDSGGGVMAAIDTALVDDGTFLAGTGTPAKIRKSNGAVERGTKSQRASRVVRYRPSNGNLSTMATVPTSGTVSGETWSRTWGDLTYTVRIHEEGVQESLVMGTVPSLPGGTRPDDYVMIEEHVPGLTLPDGWLDAPYTDEDGYYYDLPRAWNGAGAPIAVRRLVRSDAQGKWVLTGLLVSDVQAALYPVTIDPDYSADTADGHIHSVGSGTWSTARTTSVDYTTSATDFTIGWTEHSDEKTEAYGVYRPALKFATADIPDGDTVSAATMTAEVTYKNNPTGESSPNSVVYIKKYDWSASDPISAGNRETIFDGILAATDDDATLCDINTASVGSVTSGSLNTAWINKTGYTYYGLIVGRDKNNNDPGSNPNTECILSFASQDHGTAAYRPFLSITHSGGGGGGVKHNLMLMGVG